jgi:hypothetical protein
MSGSLKLTCVAESGRVRAELSAIGADRSFVWRVRLKLQVVRSEASCVCVCVCHTHPPPASSGGCRCLRVVCVCGAAVVVGGEELRVCVQGERRQAGQEARVSAPPAVQTHAPGNLVLKPVESVSKHGLRGHTHARSRCGSQPSCLQAHQRQAERLPLSPAKHCDNACRAGVDKGGIVVRCSPHQPTPARRVPGLNFATLEPSELGLPGCTHLLHLTPPPQPSPCGATTKMYRPSGSRFAVLMSRVGK